jgi:peroxiredoxin
MREGVLVTVHRFGRLALAIAAVAFLAACTHPLEEVGEASFKPQASRRQAPDFRLRDAQGKYAKLSDYRGKVVLLNFWATWCPPCKIEIPWFVEFEKQYKDRGFAVIGVSMDEDGWDAVRPYLAHSNINYRVVVGDDIVGQLYGGVDSLPTTFMIDREGRVANVHLGLVSKSDYRDDIEKLLNAGPPQTTAANK